MPHSLAYTDPRQLKRDIRNTVLCVVAFIATMNIVATVVIVIAVFAQHPSLLTDYALSGSSTNAMTDAVTDSLNKASTEYMGLASILGMVCGLPWFFLLRGKSFLTKDVTKTHSKVKPATIVLMFAFILGIQFLMTLVQLGLEPFFSQADSSLTDALDEGTTALASNLWGVLYIVILGPICEELVFRGAVMRNLEKYGANFAIVVSSLLFGLYHIILFQSVFAFFVGLVLGYTAGRFSLKWAMLLHMLNNGISVLSLAMGSEVVDTVITLCFLLSFVVVVVALIVGRKYLLAQKVAGAPSEPRVFERAFSSPWLIAYIVMCVLGGVSLLGIV